MTLQQLGYLKREWNTATFVSYARSGILNISNNSIIQIETIYILLYYDICSRWIEKQIVFCSVHIVRLFPFIAGHIINSWMGLNALHNGFVRCHMSAFNMLQTHFMGVSFDLYVRFLICTYMSASMFARVWHRWNSINLSIQSNKQ